MFVIYELYLRPYYPYLANTCRLAIGLVRCFVQS